MCSQKVMDMKRWSGVLACVLWGSLSGQMSAVTYTREDSLTVVRLLEEGKTQPAGTNMPMFFAERLIGVPYVAATLEINDWEDLVVNLRQLDCTTLVENVVALTRTVRKTRPSFEAFCRELETIRYKDGVRNGYSSRNHYFSEWIDSNSRLGIVAEVKGEAGKNYRPFTAVQKLNLNYMSTHPDKYPMLKGKPDEIARISANEKESGGKTVRYIPFELLDKGKEVLGDVCDGDILAIVTKKNGLDTSHLGFAVWQNGKLHLLNASSIHKKVVLEPMTLSQYMKKHPSQAGVRVVRILP